MKMKNIDNIDIKDCILDCNKKTTPTISTIWGVYLDSFILFNIGKQIETLLKLNDSILFFPFCSFYAIIHFFKLEKNYNDIKRNTFHNMKNIIDLLTSNNINISKNNLKKAFTYEKNTVDGKRKFKRDNIYFVDNDNCLRILQKKVLLKRGIFSEKVRYEKISLLNKNEMEDEIENLSLDEYRRLYNYFNFGFDKTDSHYISLLKKRQKNHILEWYKRKSRSTLIGLALFLGLSYTNIIKNYSSIENALTSSKVVSYLEDNDKLSEKEIEEILNNINKDIEIITDDDKFNLNNIDTKEEKENYLLLNAITSNKNMTKEEKELYLDFYDFYLDNPYLDKVALYERLKDLEFVRENEISDETLKMTRREENKTIIVTLAEYFTSDNKIAYYYRPSNDTIIHEGVHCNLRTYNIPSSIVEGIAEIIKAEYFDCDNFSYYRNTSLTKAIVEIVGQDVVLKSISLDDISYLREALISNLVKNGKDKDDASMIVNSFLDDINVKFSDTKLGNYASHKIDLKQFYVYDEHSIESIERFNDLVDDFYYDYYPDNEYYYFNKDNCKELIKY